MRYKTKRGTRGYCSLSYKPSPKSKYERYLEQVRLDKEAVEKALLEDVPKYLETI